MHGVFLAQEEIERVSFRVVDSGRTEAVLRGRVESTGLDARRGEETIQVSEGDCDAIAFDLLGQSIRDDSQPRWRSIDIQLRKDESISAKDFDACEVLLRPNANFGRTSLRFDTFCKGQPIGDFEVHPTRRHGWLPMYPRAAVTDVLVGVPIALIGVVAILLPHTGNFTWTPDGGVRSHPGRRCENAQPGDDLSTRGRSSLAAR